MVDEPLDEVLLEKIMRSVRIEIRWPMRLRISRMLNGKVTDSHEFEVSSDAKLVDVQKQVTTVALRWKGRFTEGVAYMVERLE